MLFCFKTYNYFVSKKKTGEENGRGSLKIIWKEKKLMLQTDPQSPLEKLTWFLLAWESATQDWHIDISF